MRIGGKVTLEPNVRDAGAVRSWARAQVLDKVDDEFPLFEDHLVIQIDGGLTDDAVQMDLGLHRAAGQRCAASGADMGPTVHPLAFKTWVLADEGCSGIGPDPPGSEFVG